MAHADIDRILSVLGIGAAGGIFVPAYVYGDYLATNGMWHLSYAEWFKVVGAIYIMCLLIQMAGKAIIKIYDRLIKYLGRRNHGRSGNKRDREKKG